MARRVLGVSSQLHESLQEVSANTGVPMTVILETLLSKVDEVDWGKVKEEWLRNRPTWKNIRRVVEEYRKKFPDADDKKLSELTGFSVAQVEVITHSAHKRCLQELTRNPNIKPRQLARAAGVSDKFAMRIWQQARGITKIPKQEEYLWRAL